MAFGASQSSRLVPVLRHVPHEHLGTLAPRLEAAGLAATYVDLYQQPPECLQLDGAAGLIVLGGPMNVDETDRFPFLAREVEWIRDAVRRDLPVLGICLGSQLLAKALGARVYPNSVKEIGWYPLRRTPAAADDPLFSRVPEECVVFQWHGDTFELPSGAIHLAESDACRHQAFRFGRAAYGLQFHVEVTADMIDEWLAQPENCGELASLPYIDPAMIERDTATQMPGLSKVADPLLGRFVELCCSTMK